MEKQMNIPQLRFPEFKGEWEKKKFGEEIKENGYGPRFNGEDYSQNGNVKTIRGTDISLDGEIKFEQVPSALLDELFIKNHILEEGDLVMITTADCGLTGVFRKQKLPYIPSAYAVKLKLKNTSNPYYFKYVFQTQLANNQVNRFIRKATVANLPGSDILKFDFFIPPKNEQVKIASFLSAVDEKLQALKKKKSLLEDYKKGVMQKIFSQELRFKDEGGKMFPDWEKKKLGEVFTFKVTNSFSRENLNYDSGIVKNIHYGDIHTKFSTLFNIETENVPYVNSKTSVQRIAEDNYCKEGDVILADASEDLEDVGKSIEIIRLKNQKLLSGLHTILARPKPQTFSRGFSGYLFKSPIVRIQIQKESQGSKVLSISAGRLSKIFIPIPCVEEQTKIAEFLCSLDTKINHTKTQIEKTEAWKKGLLQKMFV